MTGSGSIALVFGLILGPWTVVARRIWPLGSTALVFHNTAWTAALLVYASNLIHFSGLPGEAWAALAGGIGTFNLGTVLVLGHPPNARSLDDAAYTPGVVRGCKYGFPLAFTIGVGFYLHAVSTTFGLPSLLHSASQVRQGQSGSAFVNSFFLPARLLYFLGPLVFVTYAYPQAFGFRVRRPIRVAVLTFTALALLASLSRTLIFVALAWTAASALLLADGRVRDHFAWLPSRRQAIAVAFLGLAAFQLVAVVTAKTGSNNPEIQPYLSSTLKHTSGASVLIYLGGAIPAFGQLVEGKPETAYPPGNYGLATTSTLEKLVPGWRAAPTVSPFASVPFPDNTYTWLEPFQRDFGLVGDVGLPFLFGLGTAWSLRSRIRRPHRLLAGGLLAGLAVWAPFLNQYLSTFTLEYLGIIGVLGLGRARQPPGGQTKAVGIGALSTGRVPGPTRSTSGGRVLPGRRSAFALALALAVTVSGCGSATASRPRTSSGGHQPGAASRCVLLPAHGGYVLGGAAAGCSESLAVGKTLRMELAPVGTGGTKGRSVGVPRTLDPPVLAPVDAPEACPSGDTCQAFTARSPGHTRILWSGPSGCVAGGPCVSVAM
ncbi:MAG: O-antigen polymerase [Acidimicrobiales bacterium]